MPSKDEFDLQYSFHIPQDFPPSFMYQTHLFNKDQTVSQLGLIRTRHWVLGPTQFVLTLPKNDGVVYHFLHIVSPFFFLSLI